LHALPRTPLLPIHLPPLRWHLHLWSSHYWIKLDRAFHSFFHDPCNQ
jgi:hypothetical protein